MKSGPADLSTKCGTSHLPGKWERRQEEEDARVRRRLRQDLGSVNCSHLRQVRVARALRHRLHGVRRWRKRVAHERQEELIVDFTCFLDLSLQ